MRTALILPWLTAGLVACSTPPRESGTGATTSAVAGTGGGQTTSTSTGGGAGSGGGGAPGSGGSPGTGGSVGGNVGSGGGDAGAPTVFYDFVSADATAFAQQSPHGTITFGAADPGAHDDRAAALLFSGGTTAVGPGGKATQISTHARLPFGEYRFRARLATCKPTEDLVNGLFAYWNDGQDTDGDGLVDNDEIDIEILCGQPGFINLTSWTEYTSDTMMRKMSRTIDLDTGTIYVGIEDGYGYDTSNPLNGTIDPTLSHPGWYDPTAYYEMGWDWQPDQIRWFIVLGGVELTLWTFTDATRIPQYAAAMDFNLWHPSSHWNEGGTAAPAAADATLSIDWFSFTAGQ